MSCCCPLSLTVVALCLWSIFQYGEGFHTLPSFTTTTAAKANTLKCPPAILYMSSRGAKQPKRRKGGKVGGSIKKRESIGEDLDALERAVDFKFFGKGGTKEVVVPGLQEDDEYESTKPLPKTRGPNAPKATYTGFLPLTITKTTEENEYDHA